MIDSLFTSPFIDAIAYALLASLWQGAIVCSIAAIALIALHHRGPQVRYSAACAGLALMVALPIVTAASTLRDLTITNDRPPISATRRAPQTPSNGLQMRVGLESPIASAETPPGTRSHPSALTWSVVAVLAWASGAALFGLRLVRSWIVVEQLRRHAVQPVTQRWRERMERIARRLGVAHQVRFVQSHLIEVPMVIGWLRPMILMPVSALSGLPPPQLDAIIAHEMAHIRRHDFVVNVLQAIAETLLFYHPCTWWLSGRIRAERELCCDDIALTVCEDREVYAHALVELEQLRQMPPVIGLGASARPLECRIRRILGIPNADAHRSAVWLAISLVVAIVVLAGQTAFMQVAKADGVLRGQVLDAATAQPVAGAFVTLSQGGDFKTAVTDGNGRYEVSNIAPGEYWVTARATGYVPTAYGQRLAAEEGAPVEIRQGRASSGIDVHLQRSATVHGRILDVRGNGFPGVEVEIMAERYRPGGTMLAPMAFARTEDLGEYRVSDLPAGKYYVRAYAPGSASAAGPKKIYASTYLPGTTDRDQAQPIVLSSGQELFGADMSLVTVDTVTVTGVLIDPEQQSFQHSTVVLRSPRSRSSQVTNVTADGVFRFSDVVPGLHFLVVQEPRCEPSASWCDAAALRSADRWAGIFEPLEVDGDMSKIRLVAGQGARLEGRIIVDSPSDPLDMRTLRVSAVRHLGAQPNVTEAETIFSAGFASADGTFAIEHVRGRATLEVASLPEGWSVKSVRAGNRDVADQPTDFGEGEVSGIEIVVTNRLTQLFGRVSNARGNGVASYTVVVFPEDRDRWIVPSRLVRGVRSGNDTLYEIRGLPSGRYLAVAVESLPMNAWNDPSVLELLSSSGTPFQLEDGERRTLNLRLSVAPPNVAAR